jgi:UDP-glucuronate 4-epimerase
MTSHSIDSGRGRRFLVTGAYGCIGAWVIHHLVHAGATVVTYDLGGDDRRLRLLLSDGELERVAQVHGDITDREELERTIDEREITSVLHLAALQVPFCKADPVLGAHVNVAGTINLLEAIRARSGRMTPLVYASSVAVYDAVQGDARPAATLDAFPSTLYGVYKRANEGAAYVYAQDHGVSSIGLRPHTVYGVGRDQGLTSAPTVAMLAAAAGVPYAIPFGGRAQFQLASDVAAAFVAAARVDAAGAAVYDLPGHVEDVADIVAAIEAAAPGAPITHAEDGLPFPAELSGEDFLREVADLAPTPLEQGVAETVEAFRRLLAAGAISPPALAGVGT